MLRPARFSGRKISAKADDNPAAFAPGCRKHPDRSLSRHPSWRRLSIVRGLALPNAVKRGEKRRKKIVLATPVRPSFAQKSTEKAIRSPSAGKTEGRRSADRRNRPLSALAKRGSAPCAAAKSTRTCANQLRGALASRRSTAALARLLHLTQLQARFSGTRSKRALPALSCPGPVKAPHAPAVVPEDMMPKAARERIANPRAGTALAPPFGLASREAPLDERDGRLVTERGTDVKKKVTMTATVLSSPACGRRFCSPSY